MGHLGWVGMLSICVRMWRCLLLLLLLLLSMPQQGIKLMENAPSDAAASNSSYTQRKY